MPEYTELKKEIKKAETDKNVAVKTAEQELENFIKAQTFTGAELLKIRDKIIDENSCKSLYDEPRLDYILEKILADREDKQLCQEQ